MKSQIYSRELLLLVVSAMKLNFEAELCRCVGHVGCAASCPQQLAKVKETIGKKLVK